MLKAAFLLLTWLLLLGALLCPATIASELAVVEKEAIEAARQSAAVMVKPASETVRGVVYSVDEGNDTITLRLSPDTIEQFRVQDGLVFNAVRRGEEVEVTVQDISGAKTIVGLKKQ